MIKTFQNWLEILASNLPSRNTALAMAIKDYTETNVKLFWFYLSLLVSLLCFKYIVRYKRISNDCEYFGTIVNILERL